jgi:hypothetical protein
MAHFIRWNLGAVVFSLLAVASMSLDYNASFFFAPLLLSDRSGNTQIKCRAACADISNDHALHLGGYVAWILSKEENDAAAAVLPAALLQTGLSTPPVYVVLGGNRWTSNSAVWYWTEFPAQWIAHDARGLPFYSGVTKTNGPAPWYANFGVNEPNNYLGNETQLALLAGTGTWNDLTADKFGSVGGCICRRWTTPTASYTYTKKDSGSLTKACSESSTTNFVCVRESTSATAH